MAQANNNGESSNPFISFSSPETESIFKPENGVDANIFLSDTPVLHDQRGVTATQNDLIQVDVARHEESETDDQILLSSNILDNSALENSLPDAPTERDISTPPFNETKEVEILQNESMKKEDMNRVLVDTAAPFESVRAAVTKFRGIVDCKAEETMSAEKQKQALLELKKVQDETLKYQKSFQDEETTTAHVLEELDYFKGLAEELHLRLERAETLKEQAKQDSELAELRLREVEQGIANVASIASKAQLDVANERHASAVAELKSVKEESETVRIAYVSLLQERDIAVEKAADSFSATKDIELTINDLALKLITSKELLESAHATHLRAADQMIIAALALDIEKLMWHNLLKHAEEESQQVHEQMLLTNDVKSELCSASALLVNLKAELASLDHATSELDEARSHIGKSRENVSSLQIQLSSLQCELEREKAALSILREREGFVSASISSLEAQLNSVNFELELVRERKEVTKKMAGEEQAKLQEASKEAERVKLVSNTAHEEVRKAKEDATQTKAEATAMELRLTATLKEIEAAKASLALASSEVKSLQGIREESNGVTLPREEYNALSEKAKEADEQAKRRTISAIEQMEAAKESASRSLEKLEKAKKTLEEKKKELRAAMERVEKSEEERLLMEQELQKPTGEQEHGGGFPVLDVTGEPTENSLLEARAENSKESPRGLVERVINTMPEPRRRKRMFFARIVTFLARKKVQSLK
ncbi:protein WEAK CHLOROPLAST MOVEMENT UNDER BLUE LIGHT-like 3 [Curcuma longa]|uniref:protein WEAK CHLOROPLAST MOVEMENT UNDER BLUE LIGHT-like 3 n=1 Tax=Curcuma longa TaxID=136217 RepID=UPI003D9DB39F